MCHLHEVGSNKIQEILTYISNALKPLMVTSDDKNLMHPLLALSYKVELPEPCNCHERAS